MSDEPKPPRTLRELLALAPRVCDVTRKETFTRFFLAERFAGSPADLTWESQAPVLAPLVDLRAMLTHPGDQAVLDAFEAARG